MKRLFLSILLNLFLFSPVFATNVEIIPTMQSKTNSQDRVWVATFQLVWNDFMDKVAFNQIKFPAGTPVMVNELNKQEFTADDLSGKSVYRYVGKIKKNTKKTIVKAIKKKFNETSDIIDKLDLSPSNDRFLIYAMLKKDFEFVNPFDKLGRFAFRDNEAEYFGIDGQSDKVLDEGVKVLFYNNPEDFAVVLDTNSSDEVFLYKTHNTKPFNYIYTDMLKKARIYSGNIKFSDCDELRVPNLKFFEEKNFEELANKRVKGTNLIIEQALESVKFEMNNTGVKLKSEAAMTAMTTALLPPEEPRLFYFNDTFVVFVKEKNKTKPYFALRVYDISNYQ